MFMSAYYLKEKVIWKNKYSGKIKIRICSMTMYVIHTIVKIWELLKQKEYDLKLLKTLV
jgi:hypothetical protein